MIGPFLRAHPLLRFLAVNLALGVLVALLAVGGLMALDVRGLRHLVLQDQSPWTALLVLAFGFVVTFASALMGTAIMALGDAPRDPPPSARAGAVDGPPGADAPAGRPRAVTVRR